MGPQFELLDPLRLCFWCDKIDLPEGAKLALLEMANTVHGTLSLQSVLAEFYEKHALKGEWERNWIPLAFDERVTAVCGTKSSLFYLLAHLSVLPHTWSEYQRLGVSEEVFKDTMLDFRFYSQDYFELNGEWGFALFPWVWRHLSAELFRIGRMQYILIPFTGGIRAFRGLSPEAPRILLAADPLMPLQPDGSAWGAGRPTGSPMPPESAETWRPTFEVRPDGWLVNAVSPYGNVQRQQMLLPASEWELLLQPGDTVLDLHIPRKDDFRVDSCKASYSDATRFFASTFPDRPFRALFCDTWLFAPQLQEILPKTSNIVKFQREFYLYPGPGTGENVWRFVFGDRYPDRDHAPRDTSLRRSVLDRLDGGGKFFELPGLLFHEPEKWGEQPYMSQWDEDLSLGISG